LDLLRNYFDLKCSRYGGGLHQQSPHGKMAALPADRAVNLTVGNVEIGQAF
jgi:hypothetical protein